MTNHISFQDQTFVPVGVDAGLSTCDGEAVLRVIKPEDNMEPDVPTYARLVGGEFHNGTIEVDVWAHIKAEIADSEGRFYVDNMDDPALVVPQMFAGAEACGGVGLYVDNGTDGLFRNLQVTYAD